MIMLSNKDAAIVYETLLSSPGMNDTVKIALPLSRKNILLLAKLIEQGLATKGETEQTGILSMMNEETATTLHAVTGELLKKAGLNELNEKLNTLKQ
jgi:hypothetical protein